MGSLNAALPANSQLQEIARQTIGLNMPCTAAFYDLDTDKNVLDYFTFLKVSATDNRFDEKPKHSFRHFLYSSVLAGSLTSTCFALFHIHRGWV